MPERQPISPKIFGIDLGTTNSCLAVLEPSGPRVIAIDGEPVVPSVVSLDRQTGRFVVGRRARNRQALDPEGTVRSIKRRMGETAPVRVGDRELLPEAIAAEILRYLKEKGEEALGEPVARAVITVPAYFGDAQRRATIRAGELAGLEVVRLLNEPTAAALLYDRLVARRVEPRAAPEAPPEGGSDRRAAGTGEEVGQRVLVYDLGGGTFDVSVVEIGGGLDEVLASGGDNRLGGDDFDRRLADHLAAVLEERAGRELPSDLFLQARLEARLLDAAERAKIDLSSHPYTRVVLEALLGEVHLDLEIDRPGFEALFEDLLAGTLTEVDRALAEARLRPEQIDRVILVGGSTHIPRVQELLRERFACPVDHAVDPSLAVALGAAVQGAILAGQVFDHILVDVAAHSLGIRTLDDPVPGLWGRRGADCFSTIIRRNTQVPVARSELYRTVVDGQKRVEVDVYQGESSRCSENTRIGHFLFELLPAPAGSPVEVELRYDLDGIIHVAVHQKGTDNRREVTLSTRTREVLPAESAAGTGAARPVENYILRKARALALSLPAGGLKERLDAAARFYEEVLADPEADPGEVDPAEEELLELLEEAEEEAPIGT